MSDNLVLDILRSLRSDMTEMKADIRDVKHRMNALKISFANFVSTEASHYASTSSRLYRLSDRMDRVERRLEFSEAPIQ